MDVIYKKGKPLIVGQNEKHYVKQCPLDENYGYCVVFIDCFEIFTDRPLNVEARAQTFPSYKDRNTVKYLIGITPQGSVSFISNGWEEQMSDKYIT